MTRLAISGSILAGWVPDNARYRSDRCTCPTFCATGHAESGSSVVMGIFRFDRLLEDGYVLMDDEMDGITPVMSRTDGTALACRRTSYQRAVTDSGVQGYDVLEVGEARRPGQ